MYYAIVANIYGWEAVLMFFLPFKNALFRSQKYFFCAFLKGLLLFYPKRVVRVGQYTLVHLLSASG